MKRILAINGSHRGNHGYTRVLIDKLFLGAQRAGATFETVVLANHEIEPCSSCSYCQTHHLECRHHDSDDVAIIFDKMRKADILIYATPVYVCNVSSLFKRFIERVYATGDVSKITVTTSGLFFHHIERSLLSKPFVVLTCQDNIEDASSETIISYFNTFSKFVDAPIVGIIRQKGGALVEEKRYQKIHDIYQAIEDAGVELATLGAISKQTQKRANQNIFGMPKVIELCLRFNVFRHRTGFMKKILKQAQRRFPLFDICKDEPDESAYSTSITEKQQTHRQSADSCRLHHSESINPPEG